MGQKCSKDYNKCQNFNLYEECQGCNVEIPSLNKMNQYERDVFMSCNLFRQNPKKLIIFVKQCKQVFPNTCKDLVVIKAVCNILTQLESEKAIPHKKLKDIVLDHTAIQACKQNNERIVNLNELNPKKGGNMDLYSQWDEVRDSMSINNRSFGNMAEFTEFDLNED